MMFMMYYDNYTFHLTARWKKYSILKEIAFRMCNATLTIKILKYI